MNRKSLIAGNWKMNGVSAAIAEAEGVANGLPADLRCDVALCPPATLLAQMAWKLKGSAVILGGQDCSAEKSGAFTGDISAEMLKDAGARLVILGHSERRTIHGESDALIARKLAASEAAGLSAILCVGESQGERDSARHTEIVGAQLAGSIPASADPSRLYIAYEPVWAIGTGRVASIADIEEMHGFIRAALTQRFGAAGAGMPILYGGSVKPDNARDILHAAEVGGALVGGASLKAADFLKIISA